MHFKQQIELLQQQINAIKMIKIYGRVISVTGVLIKCKGINGYAAIGATCKIKCFQRSCDVVCEVIGFDHDIAFLMPFSSVDGVSSGSVVEVCQYDNAIAPDESWLGRVINAFGAPIDDAGPLRQGQKLYSLQAVPPSLQRRNRVGDKIDLGVKVINTFTSCCYGQRMGIFAGSGVGKSVLIAMMTKYAKIDVKVIGLVGERSREVKEFIEEYLGADGLRQAVIIVATGDESALSRKRAAFTTMAVAEFFRDQGKEVLCIIDSITRFAMAQREIGLAIGEPPTTKGYTPSVFSELPKLLERAGPGANGTNITGLFTVLVEGDDHNETVSDIVRGTLDGHIVMDRAIAERGRFPAVDVLKSISRTMPNCNSELENRQVTAARSILATYNDMAEMIRLGAYKRGTDLKVDNAITYYGPLESFMSQKPNELCNMEEGYNRLGTILGIKK